MYSAVGKLGECVPVTVQTVMQLQSIFPFALQHSIFLTASHSKLHSSTCRNSYTLSVKLYANER